MSTTKSKYINLLYKNNLIKEMEEEFERLYPLTKVAISILPNFDKIRIAITDRNFHFIKSYIATDFNCVAESASMVEFQFKDMPKSKSTCLDDEIRRFYLRFMKKSFETYKEDFKAEINKQADLDLGETTTF